MQLCCVLSIGVTSHQRAYYSELGCPGVAAFRKLLSVRSAAKWMLC